MDIRDEFLGRIVHGRSFAEVGGLWGIVNEKVSVALQAGAASATMIDVTLPDAELWVAFRQRIAEFGLPPAAEIARDVCSLAQEPDGPTFDVLHCSGVVYHHPSPLVLLLAMRKLTREFLVLTSAVQQEEIENRHGHFTMPPSGVLFVPALNPEERLILSTYWRENAGVESCLGISEPVPWDARDFGPWWWLPTPRALAAWCESCDFTLVAQAPSWNGNACTLLLRAGRA
ncbi:MAG: hypothetical protein HY821_21120 [Acidobacteria bacterium]|nr:hypothetical protein [Acidobacteriota bacterium]